MFFLMSLTLQVAAKLFDQQALKPLVLFCNLIRILLLKFLTRNLTCSIFLKSKPTLTIHK